MTNNGQRKDRLLNRSGITYNHMGTESGLRALSSAMGRDVSNHEWSMPWDIVAIPPVFETRRRLGDSVKFVFAEEGLFVDNEDVGQHRGKLHRFSSFFAFSRAPKPALACKLNADTQFRSHFAGNWRGLASTETLLAAMRPFTSSAPPHHPEGPSGIVGMDFVFKLAQDNIAAGVLVAYSKPDCLVYPEMEVCFPVAHTEC
jgi:hypothetical protein